MGPVELALATVLGQMPEEARREAQREAFLRPRAAERRLQIEPLPPGVVSLAGGLLDAASTYTFLKRGTAREDNALIQALARSPEATGLAGVGLALALQPARRLLARKWPRVADILSANQGALQLGYGAGNLDDEPGKSSDSYRSAVHQLQKRR